KRETEDKKFASELWVCPDRSFLVLKATGYYLGQVRTFHELHDLYEVSDGLWAPRRITAESLSVHANAPASLDWRKDIRVVRFEPDKTFDDSTFRFDVPLGVDVQDRRTGVTYHNDPWWPEASRFMRDQFDWPPADFTPLGEFASNTENWPEGRPA